MPGTWVYALSNHGKSFSPFGLFQGVNGPERFHKPWEARLGIKLELRAWAPESKSAQSPQVTCQRLVAKRRSAILIPQRARRKNRWLAERYDVKRVAALLMRLRKSFPSFKFFKMADGHGLYLHRLGKWFGSYGGFKSPWIVSLRGVWIGW